MRVQTFSIAAALFLAVTCGMYLWLSQDIIPEQPQLLGLQVQAQLNPQHDPEVQLEPILNSDIPSYQLSASRQVVEPISIHRIDIVATKKPMVVLDKVVVAPRQLHQAPVSKAIVTKPLPYPQTYTIQLLASHDSTQLERLVQTHHLRAQMQIRRVQKGDKAWYVLTFGEYNEREHAIYAIDHLPRDLIQFKPWVRQIGVLN